MPNNESKTDEVFDQFATHAHELLFVVPRGRNSKVFAEIAKSFELFVDVKKGWLTREFTVMGGCIDVAAFFAVLQWTGLPFAVRRNY